ncbi:MAG: hypothetical protein V2I54_10840 [Bacteroidales bacterium]|jgi:DNA-binding NtrC family response regulator|nr:hypothetical protein [Bacteroidales bacterium]
MSARIFRQNALIYFIDHDDSYIRDVLARFEELNDYNITIYSRSKEFFEDFSRIPPTKNSINIVFLSTNLETDEENQQIEPIEVLKKIKQINPYSEVILYSENDDINLVSSSFHHGAYTFIKKNENITLRIENNIKGILSQKNFQMKRDAGVFITKLFLLFLVALIVLSALIYFLFPEWFSA